MTPIEVIEVLPALYVVSLLMGMVFRFEMEICKHLLRLLPNG